MMLLSMVAGPLRSAAIAAAVTPPGTVIPSVSSVSCILLGSSYRFDSNTVSVTVPQFYLVAVAPPGSGFVKPGRGVSFVHTVSNRGNIPDTFTLEAAAPPELSAVFYAADGVTPLADSDGDGKIDTGPLASGAETTVVVKVTASANAKPGAVLVTALQASSTGDRTVTASVSDSVTVLDFWNTTRQEVVPAGQVPQGTTLTYTYTFGIDPGIPANNVLITDALDPNLSFVEGSATLPPRAGGAESRYDATSRTLSWRVPAIPGGYLGSVSFKARVTGSAASDSTIANTFRIASDENAESSVSNTVVSPVVEQPLRLLMTAAKSEAETGEFVGYAVQVENVSSAMTASEVQVVDTLPHGLRYVRGSSTLDGVPSGDPEQGTAPRWALGALGPGERKTVVFKAIVSVDAMLGDAVNRAVALGRSPGGNSLASPAAAARVKIVEGALNDKAVILGRVFVDRNRDLMPDADEPGVPGIRLFLENGFFAVTDGEGKFSLVGVDAGEHVLKLDPSTLPHGFQPVPLDNTFAGDGGSRFITVPFGGSARGDFALFSSGSASLPKPKEAKAPGEERVYTFSTLGAPPSLEEQIATMPDAPEILEPAKGTVFRNPWSDIVIRVPDGAEYTLRVNGVPLLEKQIGKTIVETERKIRICRYVGARLEPGLNTIALEVRGPDGRAQLREIEVFAPGELAKLTISHEGSTLPADGRSVLPFSVTFLDKDDRQVSGDIIYSVSPEKGEVVEPDLDPAKPGHQLKAPGGKGSFALRSTLKTGPERVLVEAGTNLKGEAQLFYTPVLRDWVVAGLGSLRAGSNSVSGNGGDLSGDDRFEKGFDLDGRFAIFAKGALLDQYLVTAAYDSKKKETNELFQRIPPDRYYPIYGDSSLQGYEAESREKYYARIERDRSYLLVGDFNTSLTSNEFSRYDRSFNGVKADIDTKSVTLRAFGTSTSHSANKEEIPGNGTSGYYFLKKKPIIENSEKIRIEVRDRYHSERVISLGDKFPYLDYSLDYRTGALLFREPVPSYDVNLNPVRIVILYESEDGGDENHIYGGRAGVRSDQGSQVGVTAVVEENGTGTDSLLGADAALKISETAVLKLEAARSDTVQNGEGVAWKSELGAKLDKALIDAYYRHIDRNFRNLSMTGSEVGSEKYGGKVNYLLLEKTKLVAEGFVQSDQISKTSLTNTSLGVSQQMKLFTLDSGYRFLHGDDDAGVVRSSHMLLAGISGKLSERLEGSLLQEQALSSETVREYPSRTLLKLNYKLNEKSSAFLTEEFRESGANEGHNTLMGITTRLRDNVILTTSYRESAGPEHARQVGSEVSSKWDPAGGLSVTTRTGYQIQNAMNGDRGQALLGVETMWEALKGLRVGAKAERVQLVTGSSDPSGFNTALALSAAYLASEQMKGSARYEFRDSPGETTHLTSLGGAWKLSESVSLLGRSNLFWSDKPAGNDRLFDAQLGAAYRPLGRNSLYLLAALRFKEDSKGSITPSEKVQSLVASVELADRVLPNLTLQGKYAGKYNLEKGGAELDSYTDMIVAGGSYDLIERLDLGVFAKVMNQYQCGVTSYGVIPLVGYRVHKNARVEIGYNFSRVNDRDLSGESYTSSGPFIQFKFKFDEVSIKDAYAGIFPPHLAAPEPPPPSAAPSPESEPVPAALRAELSEEPVQLLGSVEALRLLVNDREAPLPRAEVRLVTESESDVVELKGSEADKPLLFQVQASSPERVLSWRLVVAGGKGEVIHQVQGKGAPQEQVAWELRDAADRVQGGEIYHYRLEAEYADGARVTTPYRVFGVNRTSSVAMSLTGGAFASGSSVLSGKAQKVLREAARLMRKNPQERVVIEGHTDDVGRDEANMELSRRRSQAAADYLIRTEKIAAERLIIRWHGKSRPIASNALAEGRELNRRVEIKGEFSDSKRVEILDQHRVPPSVRIAGSPVQTDTLGRFSQTLPDGARSVEIEIANGDGRSIRTTLPLPEVTLPDPLGEPVAGEGPPHEAVSCRFTAKTLPGNTVTLDGKNVPVAQDGSFTFTLARPSGATHTLQVRDAAGCGRNFRVGVSEVPTGRQGKATERGEASSGQAVAGNR